MALQLGDIAEYLDPGIEVTVKGKIYRIPEPSAEVGLWVQAVAHGMSPKAITEGLMDAESAARLAELPPPASVEGKTYPQIMLGDAYDQLIADGVPLPHIHHLSTTMTILVISGEPAAEQFYVSGGRPEASSPANRATRRATTRTRSSSKITSTAEATTTRVAASGTGTRSRQTPSGSATPSRSPGRKSSARGAQ